MKYAAKEFGTCPLVQCNGQPVLPVGLRDEIGVDTAKIFCPKCKCVYQPPPIRSRSGHHSSNSVGGGVVDGAAFGTTFPHLFLMTFNNLVPDSLPANSAYIPRVFGFRVHHSAHRQERGGKLGLGAVRPTTVSYNNRRGGASYAQRRANMTSTRRGSGGGGATVPVQAATAAAVKEEGKGGEDGGSKGSAEAGKVAASSPPKVDKKEEGVGAAAAAAAEGGNDAANKEKAAAGGGEAGNNGDGSSKSSTKKRGGSSNASNENGSKKRAKTEAVT